MIGSDPVIHYHRVERHVKYFQERMNGDKNGSAYMRAMRARGDCLNLEELVGSPMVADNGN